MAQGEANAEPWGYDFAPCEAREAADRVRHDKMVSLVQRMLDLHKRVQAAKTDHERTALDLQIAATDDQIDHLVHRICDLAHEEIALAEESMKK